MGRAGNGSQCTDAADYTTDITIDCDAENPNQFYYYAQPSLAPNYSPLIVLCSRSLVLHCSTLICFLLDTTKMDAE